MKLLIKSLSDTGLAAHIPDAHGAPLCQLRLKLANWRIEDRTPPPHVICQNCKQTQAKIDQRRFSCSTQHEWQIGERVRTRGHVLGLPSGSMGTIENVLPFSNLYDVRFDDLTEPH